RRLSPLTPAQLERLERCEAAMTERLLHVLDAEADVAAVVSRGGSGLSRRRLAGGVSGYTHLALARPADGEWWIHHLCLVSLLDEVPELESMGAGDRGSGAGRWKRSPRGAVFPRGCRLSSIRAPNGRYTRLEFVLHSSLHRFLQLTDAPL